MKWFVSICLTVFFLSSRAQSDSTYQIMLAKANLFHLQKDFIHAIPIYERAFRIHMPDALTAYKAAGMFALNNDTSKAFRYLTLSISAGWTEADWLVSDPYFRGLQSNRLKWKKIVQRAYQNEHLLEKNIAFPGLRKDINLMTLNDQKLRYRRTQGVNDSILRIIDGQIRASDLNNLKRAKAIIKKYGWLKKSDIGEDGQNNLWLIVQHADQDILFQQKALSAMEKLLWTKEVSLENYAFLYDRVQCNLNYKQLYGTQVIWKQNGAASAFRPILEENMVDLRREKLSLQALQIYAHTYGFNYQRPTIEQARSSDSVYRMHVQVLLENGRQSYLKKEFEKAYDYFNNASTFLGGMNDNENFEAAVIFSKIASINNDDKYKNIAIDFLDLLSLRNRLTKAQLAREPSFETLQHQQRWLDLSKGLP